MEDKQDDEGVVGRGVGKEPAAADWNGGVVSCSSDPAFTPTTTAFARGELRAQDAYLAAQVQFQKDQLRK